MNTYDLRSDTVTKPSPGMRKAMYEAEVGDDVYGEDPTVNRLQELGARITGKDAGLFISSGSMGNLIPIYLLCGRGNEIIAHYDSHILHYELASMTAVAGVMPVPAPGERGILTPDAAEPLLRPPIYYMPRTQMIEIENTHNRAGGTCYTLEEIQAVGAFAAKHGLALHLDGARIFNAAAATGIEPAAMAQHADTVTFCLSKGLGAPVGSVLCGEGRFIEEARRVRKMLGGGMRQAGVLAAAGLYALENNRERLTDDHRHAAELAAALADVPWAAIDPASVQTNIVYFDTPDVDADTVVESLKRRGVLCGATGPTRIRMTTSLAVDGEAVQRVCEIIRDLRV